MITLTVDPTNPDRLALTATVSLFLDKVLIETLKDELVIAIREAAKEDLRTNQVVRQQVAKAAVAKLLAEVETWKEIKGE
jgi:hypothetical protein